MVVNRCVLITRVKGGRAGKLLTAQLLHATNFLAVPSNECRNRLLHAFCLLQPRARDRYRQQQDQADRLRWRCKERRRGERKKMRRGLCRGKGRAHRWTTPDLPLNLVDYKVQGRAGAVLIGQHRY